MCGIAIAIGWPDAETTVQKLLQGIGHRGDVTDPISVLCKDTAMGTRRLRIVDRERAVQPQLSFDSRLAVAMRRQCNDVSVFEFLAVDEVGGPSVRLPSPLLSILTAIRMGFRFRYELIDEFADLDWEGLLPAERQSRVGEFQTVLQNLLAESDARGNVDISEQNFYSAFDRVSAPRMRKLIANWDPIHAELISTLGILGDAKTSKEVAAANIQRFRNSLEALRILNLEFLSRSCDCVAKMISVPPAESETNAVELDRLVKAMRERASGGQPEAPAEPNKLREVA